MAPATLALILCCAVLLLPGVPLVPLPASAPGWAGTALLGFVTFAATLVTGVICGWRCAVVPLLAGWCLLSAAHALGQRLPPEHDGMGVVLTGTLCEFPKLKQGVVRFVLEVDSVEDPHEVPPRILVNWYDAAEPPRIGERWRLMVRLRSPRGLANPGAFDFERWLFTGRIGATGSVRPSARNGRIDTPGRACAVARWRGDIAERVRDVVGERPALPYLLGLSVGAYQALPEAEWDLLRRTGTIHLISVSGFHIALLAVPAAILGGVLGQILLMAGVPVVPRLCAALVAMLAGIGYGALAGFTVPTLRAVLMLVVVCGLLLLRRCVRPVQVLMLAALGVLAFDPFAPLTPGFWLSFAGVLILVVGLDCFPAAGTRSGDAARGMARISGATKRAIVSLVLSQVAVTAGLAPLLVLFFGQVPLAGSIANLVAIPLFSLAIIPLALLGALLTVASPALASPLLSAAVASVDLWRRVLVWCADLPFGIWHVPPLRAPDLLLVCIGVAWLLWPRPVPARGVGLLLTAVLLGAGPAPPPYGGLRVSVLDVGQGLSVIVETARHVLVYDAGPSYRHSDAGERVVVPALRALGRSTVDLLVISHADMDHRGGAASVLREFPHATLLGAPTSSGDHPAIPCIAGTHWNRDGVDFAILHPPPEEPVRPRSSNDGSCVLYIRSPGGSVLLPGDIESRAEEELVTANRAPPADLVLAPHHGSRTSSGPGLVAATRPRYVVFTTGYANRWKFPAPEVVDRWRAAGACLLDTAEEGAIRFEAGPGQPLRPVKLFRRDLPRLWRPRPDAPSRCT